MNLVDAEILAKSLIEKHLPKIFFSQWTFIFDRAKKRFGQCNYQKKQISLSKYLVELNSEQEVRDTILHEIAHALCGYSAGHGKKWQECVIKLGGKPDRCYSGKTVNTPLLKYTVFCPWCETKTQRQNKIKPSFWRSKPACKICCKKYNNGKFSRKFILQYKEN